MLIGRERPATLVLLFVLSVLPVGCTSGGGGGGGGGGGEQENQNASVPGALGSDWGCAEPAPEVAGVSLLPNYEDIPRTEVPRRVLEADQPETRVDLSDRVPTPCNQGQLNSCVGWAGGYGLMTFLAAYNIDGWVDLDLADRQFSPGFIFNQANTFHTGEYDYDSCTQAGTILETAFTLLRDVGCSTWEDMPYTVDDCQTQPSTEILGGAADYKITDWHSIEYDVASVRAYLIEDTPVIVVLRIGDEFRRLAAGAVYDTLEQAEGLKHAVLVVGYDDELEALKIMNSYGTEWGDGGFGSIAYDIWEQTVASAYVVGNYLNSSRARERELSGKASRAAQLNDPFGGCRFNPLFDADGDGYPDSVEIEFARFGFDPDVPDENPDYVPPADSDGDGWPDEAEETFGTDPADVDDFPYTCGYEYPEDFFPDLPTNGGGGGGSVEPQGELVAWGCVDSPDWGQCDPPAGSDFVAITAGLLHGLALRADGSLVGWGAGMEDTGEWPEFGQANVPPGIDFAAIAAGTRHGLALTADGSLVGWGANSYSQTDVPAGNGFLAIAAGGDHSLALRADGSIVGWGRNTDGVGDYVGQADVPAGNDFTAIAAGGYYSLALRADGSIVAWGSNQYGQIDVPVGNDFVAIDAFGAWGLALRADGSLVAWGIDTQGQLDVPTGNDFTAIATGGEHGTALRADGSIVAWGEMGTVPDTPEGGGFVAIDAGANFGLAIRGDEDEADVGTDGGGSVTIAASPTVGEAPLSVSLNVDMMDDMPLESFSWDLGDGTSADGFTVSHTYVDPGTYEVQATVRWCDATAGCQTEANPDGTTWVTSSQTVVITVLEPGASSGDDLPGEG